MRKLRYKEGDVFAVPLEGGGFCLGVVARMPRGGKLLLGYFFGPRLDRVPGADEVPKLRPGKAAKVVIFGDLFLMKGRWPVVSRIKDWNRSDWPMPKFVRREELSKRAFLVTYCEDDPTIVVSEERCDFNISGFEIDSVWGAGFAEAVLAKVIR
jgi:hypothetical protein